MYLLCVVSAAVCALSVIRAHNNSTAILQCVLRHPTPPNPYPARFGLQPAGVGAIHPVGPVSDFEKAGLEKLTAELKGSIEKGVAFAKAWQPK